MVEQLDLAEVAAIRVVGDVARIVQLSRLDLLQPRAHLLRQLHRRRRLLLVVRWRRGQNADRALSQRLCSDLEQQRAIHPAGIGDEDRLHLAQGRLEPRVFRSQRLVECAGI